MKCGGSCSQRDLVTGRTAFILWCVPTILIIAAAFVPSVRAGVWIPAFSVMGLACVVNARGCGRRHCRFTGPLFLLAAVASAVDAFGVLRVEWWLILAVAGAGTLFAYSLEWLRGKYVATPAP